MAEPHVGECPQGTKPCKICCEPINAGALKCIHCGSDQGWRGRLSISSTMLSLLIALFSVISVAATSIAPLVTRKNSELGFVAQGATADTVSVLVSNSGIRPGSLRSGALLLDDAVIYMHLQNVPPNEPQIVEPGKTELVRFNSKGQYDNSQTPKACRLRIVSVDFNGQRNEKAIPLDCADTLPFLSAHPLQG